MLALLRQTGLILARSFQLLRAVLLAVALWHLPPRRPNGQKHATCAVSLLNAATVVSANVQAQFEQFRRVTSMPLQASDFSLYNTLTYGVVCHELYPKL